MCGIKSDTDKLIMGLFLGAGAVWSPSAHRAYLAFSGEVDRERANGRERETFH